MRKFHRQQQVSTTNLYGIILETKTETGLNMQTRKRRENILRKKDPIQTFGNEKENASL